MSAQLVWEEVARRPAKFVTETQYAGVHKRCKFMSYYKGGHYFFNSIVIGTADCGLYGFTASWGISDEGVGKPPQCSLDSDVCIYNTEREAIEAAVKELRDVFNRLKKRSDRHARESKILLSGLDEFENTFIPKFEQLTLF